MLKHSYLVLSAFLISNLPCGPSWGQEPQTKPTQVVVTRPSQLAVTLERMDDVSRQITFSFNQKVIPNLEDIKAVLNKPLPTATPVVTPEQGIRAVVSKIKESILSKKRNQPLTDDEMEELLGKRNATEAEMGLMIEKIKAYIVSKISFSPALNGTFVWNDPQHLVFIPDPNQLSLWDNQINVKVNPIHPYFGKEFASNSLSQSLNAPAIRKVSNFETDQEGPQFIGYLGNKQYSNFIGKGPYYILFSQKVGIQNLQKSLVLTKADGSKVAYSLRTPAASGEDAFDTGGLDIKNVIGVVLDEKLNEGDTLVLGIPSWKGKSSETEPDLLKVNLIYRTAFKLKDVAYHGKLPSGKLALRSSVTLHFSSSIRSEAFRKYMQILPAPENLYVNDRGAGTVEVRLELTGGTQYQLKLAEGFHDSLGNPLNEPVNIPFTAQDMPSSLTVPDSSLVVEPNHIAIPFNGMNLKSLEVRVYDFASALDYIKARNTPGKRHSAADFGLTQSALTYNMDISNWPMNKIVSDEVVLDKAALQHSKVMKVIAGLLTPGDAVKEGFKCVEFAAKGGGSEKEDHNWAVLTDATDIGMTAKVSKGQVLVWLASFVNGQVMPNIPVKLMDSKGTLLGEGISDDKGVAVIQLKDKHDPANNRTLYLVAGDRSILALKDKEMSSAWQFSLPGETDSPEPLRGSVFTERGVYRPGEKVYIKAFVRAHGGHLSLSVKDPRAKEVFQSKIKPDAYGSADFQFDLPSEGAVGRYDIIVSNGSSNLTQSFQVEEYRVPTFLVSVDDGGRKWVNHKPLNLEVSAKYYHGGTMGGRNFKWQITRVFAPLNLKSFPGYIFQSAQDETASGDFATGDGVLNAAGKQIVTFNPEQELNAGRMKYTFEANVTDNDNQVYSSRVSGVVSPAEVFVGLKPPAKEVISSNVPVKIPFLVVNEDGALQSGRAVEVKVERIEYHQTARQYSASKVQMLNRMVGQTILTKTLQSGAAPQDFDYTPTQAGIYRFSFDSTDSQGNKARTSTYLLVAGTQAISWPRFDIEKIDIVKDKDNYKIGETARLVPQTPYKEATGLLTLEVGGVISTRVININGDTPEIKIPITADDAPNVYVSLVLVRGRQHFQKDATGFETGAPGFKIGYANLVVDPSDKRLQVLLDRSLTNVNPGEKVNIPVTILDPNHNGTQAQLTAMVVDEAVLDMTGFTTPNPLDSIYKLRPLGVRTGANWLDMPHSRRERLETLFAPGDAEIGLGDRSDLEGVLRNLFKSTAYWNPNLITDAQGKANISFTMPDNLTTYRVMVVAADKNGRYGSADHKISSQKPLMVQPVLPRFLYPGDQLKVGAMVFNNTTETAEITLKTDFAGVSMIEKTGVKKVKVDPGQSAKVTFEVQAGVSGTALFRFDASSPTHRDSGEFKIPVKNPGTNVTQVKSVKVDAGGSVGLTMPQHYVKGTAKFEVGLSVTQLTELRDAVQYLMEYPNGCIEQTTSTAYPLVVLKDLLPVIGVEVNQEDLKKFSEAGVARILSFQTSQGGLSYWPGGTEPHAFGTAFGLTALIEAKKRGYNVPDKALAGMADFLELTLRSGKITGEMPHAAMADADTRALFVMTLGRLGRPQPQYINALWDNRKEMTGFGLSMLAIAVREMQGGDQSLLEPILKAIKDDATQTQKEAYFEGKAKGGYSLDSPLRTHAAALLAYGKTNKDAQMTGKLMDGFLSRRRGDLWGNTQENVFGIMGIYESAGKGSGKSLPNASLSLNGKDIPFTSMEAPDSQVRRITYSEDELKVKEGDPITADLKGDVSGGVLTLRLNYEVPLEYTDFSAKAAGFTVTRDYVNVDDGHEVNLSAIPLGALIKVRLKVVTDQAYNYVALEDKIPAGLEPLNTELQTTEKVEQGELTMEAQKALSLLSYQEVRDHRVAFFADELPAGSYEFSYTARATSPGTFLRPAAHAEAMYDTDHFGRTTTDQVTVK